MADQAALLPWSWTLSPIDQSTTCPSPAAILGTFAAVNLAVSVLGLIVGHRVFVKYATCRVCGKQGSESWRYLWVLSLGLQFGANALVATVIRNTPGYSSTFSIWDLLLFFTARPRMSTLVIGWSSLGGGSSKLESPLPGIDLQHLRREHHKAHKFRKSIGVSRDAPSSAAPTAQYLELRQIGTGSAAGQVDFTEASRLLTSYDFDLHRNELKNPWISAALSQLIADAILCIVSLAVYGRVVHFAAVQGVFQYHSEAWNSLPGAGRVMYIGALLYLVCTSILGFVYLPMALSTIFMPTAKDADQYKPHDWGGLQYSFGRTMYLTMGFYCVAGSWVFWGGFVYYAGDSYCPPKLHVQGIIWAICSLLGIVAGAGG